MLPDWLQPFFIFFPVYAFFFLGLGVPWALVLLPRDEWRSYPTITALGLALGPLVGTTWLFALGTWGSFRLERALTGLVLLAVVGFTGAWLRRHTHYFERHTRADPWTGVERALMVMMGLGFAVHVWITLFWPFVQYDTLWTFGYNPRVFLTFNQIPNWIDYYPQLVPLTYTYGQLVNGEINDHVAKAAVPWFVFASVMMAYVLGERVWGKRQIGILTAALWLMVPSALYWSGSGDLEHPVTIYFTGAVVFFVLAWRSHHPRYALISGLMFAGALWTKPTAGSFALGVGLVTALTGVRLLLPPRLRAQLGISVPVGSLFRQKFTLATITAAASIPIGGMWYVRNLAFGHEAVTFPDHYWNDFAQRSGQELGWLVLICLLVVGMGCYQRGTTRRMALLLLGLGLFLLGTLPSALVLDQAWTERSLWDWAFGARPQDKGLSLGAILLIGAGLGIIAWQMLPAWQKTTERARSSTVLTLLLAAPFTVVWFWGYSYHYRLMLTITPIFAAMVAALLDAWLLPLMNQNALRKRAAVFLAVVLCVPGLVIAGWITFWHTAYEPLGSDDEKYTAANPSLMAMVDALNYANEQRPGRDYVNVYTLGEKRLNFFFPHMTTIDNDALPTELDELYEITDLIIGGSHADFLWRELATYPNQISHYMDVGFYYANPFVEVKSGELMRWVLQPIRAADDGTNRLVAYNVYMPYRRYSVEEIAPTLVFADAQWEFLALRGLELRRALPNKDSLPLPLDERGKIVLRPGERVYLQLYWQRTDAPIPYNYSVFIHLVDPTSGEILAQRDGVLIDGLLPMRALPVPDLVPDRRLWRLPRDLPTGALDLHIGLYDPLAANAPRLLALDGTDGIVIEGVIEIAPQD